VYVCDVVDADVLCCCVQVCHHRLFREACVCHRGNYVKDLGKVNRCDSVYVCVLDMFVTLVFVVARHRLVAR